MWLGLPPTHQHDQNASSTKKAAAPLGKPAPVAASAPNKPATDTTKPSAGNHATNSDQQKDEFRIKRFLLDVRVTDVALAVFTGLLVFFGWRQANALRESVVEMKNATKATQTAADAARDTADVAIRMELPNLTTTGIWVRGFEKEWVKPDTCSVIVEVRNYRRTPAYPFEVAFCTYAGAELTETSPIKTIFLENRIGYLPQPIHDVSRLKDGPDSTIASEEEVRDARAGKNYWIILTVKFRDYLNNSHIWRASFKWDTKADNFVTEERPAFNFQRRIDSTSGGE